MGQDDRGLDAALWCAAVGAEALVASATALRVTGIACEGAAGVVLAMREAPRGTWLLAATVLVLLLAATGAAAAGLRRLLSPSRLASASRAADFRDMRERSAVRRAREILGGSLPDQARRGAGRELVRYMGDHDGDGALWGQYEDPETTYAVTRSGKTRSLVTRRVLEAPGAVLATSTKPDGLALTWLARQETTRGRTWAFDPMGQAVGPLPVRWNPVVGCEDFNVARERGRAFALGATTRAGSGNTRWFVERGAQILGYLFHAAAAAGVDIDAVHRWVSRPSEAVEVLDSLGTRSSQMMVSALRDLMIDMAAETSSGFKGTMQGALEPVMIDSVLEALTPPREASFDAVEFLGSRDVMWVLSPESEGAVASVTTMLVDHVVSTARRRSDTLPGGRLTPPLSLVLDEAANIAPLPDLDSLYSEGAGRGIFVSAFFQDEAQVEKRWGRTVARVVYQQSRAVYVLGGSKDSGWNKRVADLSPEYEEARTSWSSGRSGTSTSTHTERRHVLREADVAALPPGRAVLAAAGHPATVVSLPDIKRDRRWGRRAEAGQRIYDDHLRQLQQAGSPAQREALRQQMTGWMDTEDHQ
ncbi:type IV secretory system conjugative DNA transfer family protein [Actinomyces wuliandei]|uniref:type IV secretory system conjugative DNA transfer family protein n=1 Tax=Actinomyces wuliandei TaxID=2057743 RepID=UPI00111A164E|nr:TraM recognition domain-containing protein [Actinomyces wuliandei]